MGQEISSPVPQEPISVNKLLNEAWVYFYAIGMTYDEYWYGNIELCEFYRKVDRFRQKRENERLWLMGAYVYQAILNVSPILHDFVKKGTKPIPYIEKPFPTNEEEIEAIKEREVEERYNKFRNYIMNRAIKKK